MSADPNFNPDEFVPEEQKESAEKKASRLKNELAITAELKSTRKDPVHREMTIEEKVAYWEQQYREALPWATFGRWALETFWRDAGDFYGGDIQDKAIELGLLVGKEVTEPCGEECQCAEYAGLGSETVTCYRIREEK